MSDAQPIAELHGEAAPPRRNGELSFAAPWESRAFGLALDLHARGAFEWEEFRERLIAEITAWDRHHEPDQPYEYYVHWLAALEKTLAAKGLCQAGEIEARERALASRPHGHDHREPIPPRPGTTP